ncbi:MAG: NAD(P)-dependent oxidoreductase [Candidatus Woesearchaeota archaeon]
MKAAFFGLNDWQKEMIQKRLSCLDLSFYEPDDLEDSIDEIKGIEILGLFVETPLKKKHIKKIPNLKLIVTLSTGYDHIDCDYARKKDINVCNVPNYGEKTVAEYAFGLMLNEVRNIDKAKKRVLETGKFEHTGLMGTDLSGKTLGVIGTGSIGMHVLKIASGFEMNKLAYDVNKNYKASNELNFNYVELSELFRKSDIISVHVPLNKHTKHMIDMCSLKMMKESVILINTSRGAIIDPDMIIEGLRNGKIGALATDVLEGEENFKDDISILNGIKDDKLSKIILENEILINHPKVTVTPHVAFYTKEAIERIINQTVMNVLKFLDGKEINVVN